MEIYNKQQFIDKETDWLYSLVNDYTWREDMWIAKGAVNKAMLNKRFWTTQKRVIEWLIMVYDAEPSLYTDCVKDMIHDKKELRKVAKAIINEL